MYIIVYFIPHFVQHKYSQKIGFKIGKIAKKYTIHRTEISGIAAGDLCSLFLIRSGSVLVSVQITINHGNDRYSKEKTTEKRLDR